MGNKGEYVKTNAGSDLAFCHLSSVIIPPQTKNPALLSEKRGCVVDHSTAPSFVGYG